MLVDVSRQILLGSGAFGTSFFILELFNAVIWSVSHAILIDGIILSFVYMKLYNEKFMQRAFELI